MAEQTVTVEAVGKELDRQLAKKQRLEDEMADVIQQLVRLAGRISKTLQEVRDPWK